MLNINESIILVGGFSDTIELAELCGKRILGIVDIRLKGNYLGYKVFGSDEVAPDLFKEYGDVPVVISPDAPVSRRRLARYYSQIGFRFTNLVSTLSRISKTAEFGIGVVVYHGIEIGAMVKIDDFVRVNHRAVICHDSHIGKYTTVAPNAVILGRVTISEMCYIGANCTILPDKYIHDEVIVGAGSVVVRDVDKGVTVVGNPIREVGLNTLYT